MEASLRARSARGFDRSRPPDVAACRGVTVCTLVFGGNELSMQQRQEIELACMWRVVCAVGRRIVRRCGVLLAGFSSWLASEEGVERGHDRGGGTTRCETRRTSGEWVKLKARVGVDTAAASGATGKEGRVRDRKRYLDSMM